MGLGFLSFFLSGSLTLASVNPTCPSAENFEATYKFLSHDDSEIPLTTKINYAEKVSKGCQDSALRFKKVYLVLKGSGVAISKSLEVAVEFASQTNDQTTNFVETFQKIFLKKYYDFDFQTAFRVSLELSRDVKEGADVLREDFINLVDFCMDEKGMTLPLKTCADQSLKAVKLNINSTTPIFPDWKSCYSYLREDARLGLNQSDALTHLEEILKGGPGSCANFKKTFEFATSPQGMDLSPGPALKVSKRIAAQTKLDHAP